MCPAYTRSIGSVCSDGIHRRPQNIRGCGDTFPRLILSPHVHVEGEREWRSDGYDARSNYITV